MQIENTVFIIYKKNREYSGLFVIYIDLELFVIMKEPKTKYSLSIFNYDLPSFINYSWSVFNISVLLHNGCE